MQAPKFICLATDLVPCCGQTYKIWENILVAEFASQDRNVSLIGTGASDTCTWYRLFPIMKFIRRGSFREDILMKFNCSTTVAELVLAKSMEVRSHAVLN
jgi:hypothetical protein